MAPPDPHGKSTTLRYRVSYVLSRWPRHVLHATAGFAIIASGGIATVSTWSTSSRGELVRMSTETVADGTAASEAIADVAQAVGSLGSIAPVPVPVLQEAPADTQAASLDLQMRTYVVEPGDTVRTIAQQFGVTNETIIWQNDLTDPDYLSVGQELQILPFSGLIHEVRPGDTIASLANGYDASLQEVIKVNRLVEPFIIVVGQKLAVPGGYRPLPQKVMVAPPSEGSDTVQAPAGEEGQQAAAINIPRRSLPALGNTPQERFIASIAEAAVDSRDRTGIPASVTIAQAILETYWGSSRLAREANNYFGIKAQTRTGSAGVIRFDVWEVIGGRNVVRSEPFRAYNTIAESFVDHGRFFAENGRYAAALAARDDPRQFAREINRAGYATDPAYASKLIALMDRYNLYRYDDV